ncbi:unnamed protein product [Soboliphyme baturini]|uniref:Transmembrane 9 superfamily member n=1 Tax=Soboliphyme baturini TaxID=241478 RepID=A0A183JAX5_9BILA|nr:unnamed protein product [Soboliphyme baturini]
MFLELFFIFTAIWQNQSYYLFGFLFLTFCVLAALSAMVTILVTYLQFCKEDYRWWWRSFICGGSSAFYVFMYSMYYFYAKVRRLNFCFTCILFSAKFLL